MTIKFFKAIIAVFLLFSLQSCFKPFFQTQYEHDKTNISFSSGKWLLNNISTSGEIQGELESIAKKRLQECLGNRLSFIDDVRSKVLLPNTAIKDFKQEDLTLLNKTTGFDYLVNISAERVQKNEGIDKFTGYPPLRTEMRILIRVYELKSGELIHFQVVRAYSDCMSNELQETDDKLFKPALKKALKNLRNHSDCK